MGPLNGMSSIMVLPDAYLNRNKIISIYCHCVLSRELSEQLRCLKKYPFKVHLKHLKENTFIKKNPLAMRLIATKYFNLMTALLQINACLTLDLLLFVLVSLAASI